MTLTRPWAIDAAFPNAADQRKQLAAIYPREGVFPDPTTIGAGVAFAGTGWGVSARAFGAVLKRGGAPYTQSYGSALISNDGVVANAWTIGAAPASGSRIDRLCIRSRDTTQGDSASGAPTDGPGGAARTGFPEFLVVTGTAATTPVAPALPAGYEEIAQIQTPSGAASTAGSTITQTYAFAQVVGGPIYVRTIAERNAIPTSSLNPGDTCVVLNGSSLILRYEWTGASWAGRTIIAGRVEAATDTNGFSPAISHGFGVLPVVTAMAGDWNGGVDASQRLFQPVLWSRSTTTFQFRWIRRDTNAWINDAQVVRYHYQAVPE